MGACFVLLNRLTALTAVPGHLLVPVILVLVFIGSYTSNSSYADIVVTLVFGAVGYFMVLAGWPRAPLVLGLVLGKIAENYLYISVARYEAAGVNTILFHYLTAETDHSRKAEAVHRGMREMAPSGPA